MSKRNVSYVKPAEPKFLAELKAEIGYKEGPTVDTKREINPEISDEENNEKDEEQPVVVVLGPGDLTAEEVAQLVSKKNTDASDGNDKVPADGRILFRRPVKREAPKESSKAEERMKERRKKVKGVKNSSLLSFDEDDEVSGEVNDTYDTMDIPIYSLSPSVVDGDLLTKKESEVIEAMQPESCNATEVPTSQLDDLRELGSEVPSSLEESCALQTKTELKDDVTRTDCSTISSNNIQENMDVNDSCEKDTVSFVSQSDSSLVSYNECKETTIDSSSMNSQKITNENPINVDETVNKDDSGKTSKSDEFSDEPTASKLESENSDKKENQVDDIFMDKDGDKTDATSTPISTTPVSKKNKKSPAILNVSPRRSSRNLNKQKSYVTKEDDDLDVQVLSPVDPLGDPLADPLNDSTTAKDSGNKENKVQKKTTIIVNDTKTLADIAAGSKDGKKEPTLVIIDTNSILSGRGPVPVSSAVTSSTSSGSSSSAAYSVLPVAVPAQGFYSQNQAQNPAHYVSIPKAHHNYLQTHYYQSHPANAYPYHASIHQQHYHHLNTNSSSSGSSILHPPSLTDDMYVVEAPSFIVPYVYEKPSKKPLKDYLEAMAKELNITRDDSVAVDNKSFLSMKSDPLEGQSQLSSDMNVNEERNCCNAGEKGDLKENEDKDKKTEIETKENSNCSESVGLVSESGIESEVKSSKNVSDNVEIGGKLDKTIDSNDNGTSNNNEIMPSDSGMNDMADSLKSGSKDDNNLKATKQSNSYFDSPIGQFFMEIGANLVQEYVQTDLLRMQKRKLNREGGKSAVTQFSINSLLKNLKCSKENNKSFHFDQLECEYCNFKTESSLVMAHHLECPHMKNYVYNCNFCSVVTRSPQNLLFHMEAEHNIRGRLEKIPAFHQCPNCPFEDCQKSKLTRHIVSCQKKYQPNRNLEPPADWEPPAKIPRIPRSRPPSVPAGYGIPGMTVPKVPGMPMQSSQSLLPKMVPSPTSMTSSHAAAAAAAAMAMRGRGVRSASLPNRYIMDFKGVPRPIAPVQRYDSVSGLFYRPNSQVLLPTPLQIAGNQVYQVVGGQRQVMPLMADGGMPSVQCLALIPTAGSSTPSGAPTPVALVPNIAAGSNSITIQNAAGKLPPSTKLLQQPSISITPLPRQSAVTSSSASGIHGSHHAVSSMTHHLNKHNQLGNKAAFVICEICDGYIKDLEQLRNHMQWIHKVKIHPKMIYNRPPLNCQKCQFRFFTDQGLERHLLGSHGLVTSSLQEAANKGMDGGRCPVCVDRVFQWKLLNHVARAHNLTLKPAHLSYKCTVCTATFGMYKQFENHVYSAHSVGPKRGISEKKPGLPISNMSPGQLQSTMPSSSSGSHRSSQSSQHADNLLKPLKINDEITIIPQPPSASVGQLLVPGPCPGKPGSVVLPNQPHKLNQKYVCQMCDARFDGAGFGQLVNHYKQKHLQDCKVNLTKVDVFNKWKSNNITTDKCTNSGYGNGGSGSKAGVDVIEITDNELVIAGKGRHEITITKVPLSATAAASSSTDPCTSKRLRKRN